MNGSSPVWRRCHELASVETDGRVAVLDLDRLARPPAILDATAAAIWHSVDGVRDELDICRIVAELYATDPDELSGQVHGFLAELAGLDLIERVEAP